MKSYTGLWEQLISWDNLRLALYRCRRRKRYKRGAVEFEFAREANLLALQRELVSGEYRPGAYRHFTIREPKVRKISAAPFRDRVLHHAVVNVMEPIYEARFITDSYACRRGKGVHRAVRRAQQYMRRYRYCLKTDIVKFFPSVDHQTLLDLLCRRFREPPLQRLLERIIESGADVFAPHEADSPWFPGDDLFAACRPRGLPIGNLTSQFFANVLLDPVDHFIKEQLRVPGYVRYADDLLLLTDDKRALWEWRDALASRLTEIRLRLHPHKTTVRPSRQGLVFLGFRVLPESRRLNQEGLRRFNRRLRRQRRLYGDGELDAASIRKSLASWQAHIAHANYRGVLRDIRPRIRFTRPNSATEASGEGLPEDET